MLQWSKTSIFYKLGSIGIFVSFAIFVAGCATPVWYEVDLPWVDVIGVKVIQYGLWQYCLDEFKDCKFLGMSENMVVRGFTVTASLVHLVAVFSMLASLVRQNVRHRVIIVSGILAGVIGLIGVIIFATARIKNQNIIVTSHLSWSFALAIIGSCLTIVSSIAVASSPGREPTTSKEMDDEGIYQQPEPYYSYVTNQKRDLFFTTLWPQTKC